MAVNIQGMKHVTQEPPAEGEVVAKARKHDQKDKHLKMSSQIAQLPENGG